jgi:DNA-directed RNA polymerase subunit alpha
MTDIHSMNITFQLKEEVQADSTSTISIEPLEQGYGHTLGNALRRVLLTSLTGCAITSVRISGADHQYSSVEGISEDVLELTLNLKQVRIKANQEGKGVLRVSVKGPKEVTAGDIECESGFEVVNKDLHIATVAKGSVLEIDMVAETGLGYVVADEKRSSSIGEIVIDALFSPVTTVSYKVEATRVGRRTDYDRLILSVQTDGTINPVDAVRQAANILMKHFSQVVNPIMPTLEEPQAQLTPAEAEALRLTVEELDLPTRIANALRKGGFKTVGDLVGIPKITIAKVKNLGEKSVGIVNEALEKKGVTLGE